MRFIQFEIINRRHGKLFRFLDKQAPGWKLTLRPENGTYQYLCDKYDLEDESGFARLQTILRTYNWNTRAYRKLDPDHHETISRPVVMVTPEQAVLCKMFWPEYCEPYTFPTRIGA